MAVQTRKIETLIANLDTKPGALAKVYGAFKEAKVNMISSWAYEMGPNQAEVIIYPSDLKQARDVLTKMGKTPRQGWACWVEGDDQPGVYADLLQKVASANVNLEATAAGSTNGKFITTLFAKEGDIGNLCKALGC